MPLTIDLTGRVVLVTGGARGVGRGISEAFRQAGATVETCGRSEAPADLPPGLGYFQADVREPEDVRRLVDHVASTHQRLDVLVNNAGGGPGTETLSASPRLHAKIVDLNLLAPLLVAQTAYPLLAADGSGSVVNISSVSASRVAPGTAVYGAAKAGLEHLTATLAVEWAPAVRVNAVAPGLIATDVADSFYGDADRSAEFAATVPLGRLGLPVEIGYTCVFLASPLAAYVSGAVLSVNGGKERPSYLSVS